MSMIGSLAVNLALDALFLGAAFAAVFAIAATWNAVGAKVVGLRGELEKAQNAPVFFYTITRHETRSAKVQTPLMLIASGRVRVKSVPALPWPELRAAA
ncbi:MAG: hypothetical protein ABIU18_08320 [Novosphingobium sp.]